MKPKWDYQFSDYTEVSVAEMERVKKIRMTRAITPWLILALIFFALLFAYVTFTSN